MPVPLYRVKAEFFRTLGHPGRIRVLELLSEGDSPVHQLPEQPLPAAGRAPQGGAGHPASRGHRGDLLPHHPAGPGPAARPRRILTEKHAAREELVDELTRPTAVQA